MKGKEEEKKRRFGGLKIGKSGKLIFGKSRSSAWYSSDTNLTSKRVSVLLSDPKISQKFVIEAKKAIDPVSHSGVIKIEKGSDLYNKLKEIK